MEITYPLLPALCAHVGMDWKDFDPYASTKDYTLKWVDIDETAHGRGPYDLHKITNHADVVVGDPPFPNARALDDPLIGGIDHVLELGIGEDSGRDPHPHRYQSDCRRRHAYAPALASPDSSRLRCSTMSHSTDLAATRTALRIARAGESPWQMIVTPLAPSSGAPPCSA